jgi:uncharacterized protein YbjT (DUF2867 family)
MIAVVGGTGRLGRLVAARLVRDGHEVRLVARSSPAEAVPGTSYAAADVRRPETLPAALDDADVVVLAAHGMDPSSRQSPAEVDRDGSAAVIDLAASRGSAVVLVSVVGASADHPLELHRMKWAAEQHLRGSGAPWTIVRATAFAEMWREVLARTARRPASAVVVFGRGANPVNFVAVDDVATAVARACTDDTLRGEVVEVGGPDDLTLDDLAHDVAGDRLVRHVPRPVVALMGAVLRPVAPAVSRVVRTGLVMDRVDLRFDAAAARRAHPWLPCTEVLPRDRPAERRVAGAAGAG